MKTVCNHCVLNKIDKLFHNRRFRPNKRNKLLRDAARKLKASSPKNLNNACGNKQATFNSTRGWRTRREMKHHLSDHDEYERVWDKGKGGKSRVSKAEIKRRVKNTSWGCY